MPDTTYIRFTNVTIPKWSRLRAVYVKFRAFEDQSPIDSNSIIYFADQVNPTTPANKTDVDAYPRTSGVGWENISEWVDDYYYRTPNLATIFQNIVNNDNWVLGNSALLLFENNGSTEDSCRTFSASEYVGGQEKPVLEIHYTPPPTLRMPEIEPEDGVYYDELAVSMVAYPSAAQIRYTIDGSEPTEDSPLYTTPFYIIRDAVVKAQAFLDYWLPSTVNTKTYTLKHIFIRRPSDIKDTRTYHWVQEENGNISEYSYLTQGTFTEDYDHAEPISNWTDIRCVWVAPDLSLSIFPSGPHYYYSQYPESITKYVQVNSFILRLSDIPIDLSTPFTGASLRLFSFYPDGRTLDDSQKPTNENYHAYIDGLEWHFGANYEFAYLPYAPEQIWDTENGCKELYVPSVNRGGVRNNPKLFAVATDNFSANDFPTSIEGFVGLTPTIAYANFTPLRPIKMMQGKYDPCSFTCAYWSNFYVRNVYNQLDFSHPRFYSVNITNILTELINRPGWVKGNSIALFVKFDSYGPHWMQSYYDWLNGRDPNSQELENQYTEYQNLVRQKGYFAHKFSTKFPNISYEPWVSTQPTLKIYTNDVLASTSTSSTTSTTVTTTSPIIDEFVDDCSGADINEKWHIIKAGDAGASYSAGTMVFYENEQFGQTAGVNVLTRRELMFTKRNWRFSFDYKAPTGSAGYSGQQFLFQLVDGKSSTGMDRVNWYYAKRDIHQGNLYWIGLNFVQRYNAVLVMRWPRYYQLPGSGGYTSTIAWVIHTFSSTVFSRIRFELNFDNFTYDLFIDDILKSSGTYVTPPEYYSTPTKVYEPDIPYGVNFHLHASTGWPATGAILDNIRFAVNTTTSTTTTTSTSSSTISTVSWSRTTTHSTTSSTASTISTQSTTTSSCTTTTTAIPAVGFFDAASANGIGTKWYSYVNAQGYNGWQSAAPGYYYQMCYNNTGAANLVTADSFERSGRWKLRGQYSASYYNNYSRFEIVPHNPVFNAASRMMSEYNVGTNSKIYVQFSSMLASPQYIRVYQRVNGTETLLTGANGTIPTGFFNFELIVDFDNHLIEILVNGVRWGSRASFSSTLDSIFGSTFKVNLFFSLIESGSTNIAWDVLDFDRYEGTSSTTTSTCTSTMSSSSSTTRTLPVEGMLELTEQVGASGDDGYTYGSSFYGTQTQDVFGNYSGQACNTFHRFTTVPIPKGSTIRFAVLQLRPSGTISGAGCNTKIHFVAEDNAATPTTYADFNGRTLTSAITWNNAPTFTDATWINSPDLKTILQTMVDRPGWAKNNSLLVYVKDNTSSYGAVRRLNSYNTNASYGAKLYVLYVPTITTTTSTTTTTTTTA